MAKMKLAKPVKKIQTINQNGYIFQKSKSLDFSLSECPLETFSPKARIVLSNSLDKINIYPKNEIKNLKEKIAKSFKLPVKSIVLGNGLEQVIDNLFRTILKEGDEIIIPLPSFFVFEKSAILAKAGCVFIKPGKNMSLDLNNVKQKISKKTKAIIISNPNNPTGQTITKSKLISLIKKLSKTLIIIDEANIEFGGETLIKETIRFKNLIVLRTFSKAFGLAGLRLGFATGKKDIMQSLENLSQTMPVGILSCLACQAALDDKKFIKSVKKFTDKNRAFLIKSLKKLGFKVFPSQSNNILIKTNFVKFNQFLNKNDISVVDASCFRGLSKGFFRISPRLESKNRKLIDLLQKGYK